MTKLKTARDLTAHEIELVRMVARGLSNVQIATEWGGIKPETVRSRLHTVYHVTGVSGHDSDPLVRVRLAIWAYEHGLVKPAGVKAAPVPKGSLPQERMPAELAAPMIRLAISILSDEPRGDLKRWARRVMDAARLHMPGALGRPSAVADTGDEAAA
jgi:DNA-binding CsgD family transcriptional regulator